MNSIVKKYFSDMFFAVREKKRHGAVLYPFLQNLALASQTKRNNWIIPCASRCVGPWSIPTRHSDLTQLIAGRKATTAAATVWKVIASGGTPTWEAPPAPIPLVISLPPAPGVSEIEAG